jgi:hypothetical protein
MNDDDRGGIRRRSCTRITALLGLAGLLTVAACASQPAPTRPSGAAVLPASPKLPTSPTPAVESTGGPASSRAPGPALAPSDGSPDLIPQPTVTGVVVAPDRDRVDLVMPSFSDPTRVTNPYFPVSRQASVLMLGQVDGKPFRTEVSLLPFTRIVEWRGLRVETLVSQYMAYLDGRLQEVAYDLYAQADLGLVLRRGRRRSRGRRDRDQGRDVARGQGRAGGDDHGRPSDGR